MPTPEIMIEPRPAPGKRAPQRPAAPEPDRRPVPPAPEIAFEPDAPKRPRRWRRIAGWLLLIVLVWCGWAAYALYDLSSALDNEDAVALERRIDWTPVRQGLPGIRPRTQKSISPRPSMPYTPNSAVCPWTGVVFSPCM